MVQNKSISVHCIVDTVGLAIYTFYGLGVRYSVRLWLCVSVCVRVYDTEIIICIPYEAKCHFIFILKCKTWVRSCGV